jgi:hypothetical protein
VTSQPGPEPASPRRYKTRATLCAIVRDEGPYLLEWIAWHKMLGFHAITIYDNESRDEGTSILPALHRAGEIELRLWPDNQTEQPQLPAYRDALSRCGTEWIAFLDVDEFLVLHASRNIADLLKRLPEACSAVAFNQRFFGSSNLRNYDNRLVIERFTHTARSDHPLNAWVKSMARSQRIKAISSPHACELTSGYYSDPDGQPCALEGYSRTQKISLTIGQYNHYILKSREEYLKKRARGRAAVARQHPGKFDKYTDEFFTLHDENVCQDHSASRWAGPVRAERDRLYQLCRI